MRRGGNEGPGEHRAVEKQEQGPPPDTRETGGLPPPNIPYFAALIPNSWRARRGGNEGPGEHRAVEKQEQGPPPDTRETGGLPPPNIPYFAAPIPNPWGGRRGGNEGPGEHRAVEKQEQGAPPDTRETGGLPPPNIPYFEGLSKPSKEEEEARTREYSGTLVQPPEPPEMRAASKGAPLGGPPPGAQQPCQMGGFFRNPLAEEARTREYSGTLVQPPEPSRCAPLPRGLPSAGPRQVRRSPACCIWPMAHFPVRI